MPLPTTNYKLYRVLQNATSRDDEQLHVAALMVTMLLLEMDMANCYELYDLECDSDFTLSLTFEGYVEQDVSAYVTVTWPRGITAWSRVIISPQDDTRHMKRELRAQVDLEFDTMVMYLLDKISLVGKKLRGR